MDLYMIVLRLLHIGGGVFWVGAAWLMVFYVAPTAAAAGPEGDRFIGRLMAGGTARALSLAALTVTISGLLLYWRQSGNLQPAWILSAPGLALTVGSLAGLTSFVLGISIIEPSVKRLGVLGAQVAAAGNPTEQQRTDLSGLQRRLTRVTRADAYVLIVAVIGMAIARSI